MKFTEDKSFYNIKIRYSDRLVQITCDPTLKSYLEEKGNGALELSAYILEGYKKSQGFSLKISQDSLAIEILAHTYADSFSSALSSISSQIPAALRRPVQKLMDHVRSHTEIIDCGERGLDNNRWIWDGLTPFKKVIYGMLGDHT